MNGYVRTSRGCAVVALAALPLLAVAQFRGGGGAMMARGSITEANRASQMAMDRSRQSSAARNGASTSRSTERNVSRESSRQVNVDVDTDNGPWGNGEIDRPLAATAVVAGTTAAIVGSMYPSVPAGCPVVHTYSVPYYHCNGVYYEQRMQGDQVVYVVVNP